MKRTIAAAFILTLAVPLFPAPGGSDDRPVSDADSEKIIAAIRKHAEPVYRNYIGVRSTRRITVKEYDWAKDKLLVTHEVVSDRRDYFYRKPIIKVLEYKKNGKKQSPSKYNDRRIMPAYQLFDRDSAKNYDLKVLAETNVAGVRCYRIRIKPRMLTERHLTGTLYMSVDAFEPVLVECSLAKLPFPLKEMSMIYRMSSANGVAVMNSGSFTMRLHVPLVNYRRKWVTTMVAEQNTPMEK